MSSLFQRRMSLHNHSVSEKMRTKSDFLMNSNFTIDPNYKRGMLYDANMNELEEVDFKFQKTNSYTISKDQVEYTIQFRPGFCPERYYNDTTIKYFNDINLTRLGFYLDIYDRKTDSCDKWLIVGKDAADSFDKYNALKCNWTFEWIDDNKNYCSCLGAIRDRNNYNSGIWSDGFSTSVQDQSLFIVPSCNSSKKIKYGNRFMLTDNLDAPRVFEVSKINDLFPVGVTKVVLRQSFYNPHTDVCGIIPEFGDDCVHMICDYNSSISLDGSNDSSTLPGNSINTSNIKWMLSEVDNKLRIGYPPITINGMPSVNNAVCKWHIYVDGEDYSDRLSELEGYFNIMIDKNIFSISAISKVMAKYTVKVAIFDDENTYYDSVEMEVIA